MKKKHIVFAVIAVVVIAFLLMRNCRGGGNKYETFEQKVELTPNESKVKGYLSEVLEVVDGAYTFDFKGSSAVSYNSGTGKMQIKIKSVSKGDANDYGLNDMSSGPLYLTICDKNGAPVTDFTDIASEQTSDGILKDMMSSNSENWISFEVTIHGGKKLPETAATFFITSKQIEKLEYSSSTSTSSSSDTDSDNENTSSSDNKEWDKVLDDYEAYVDKNLKIIKKMKNDDLTAIAEYPALMEKAKDLEESLQSAQKNKSLSSKQLNRMMKIQTKMLQATQDME